MIAEGHHTASHKAGNLTRRRSGTRVAATPNPLPPRTGRSARACTWDNPRSQPRRIGRELVVQGDADRILPYPNTGKRLPGLIKDMELVVIEGGPHAIAWTHADRVNHALLGFLK